MCSHASFGPLPRQRKWETAPQGPGNHYILGSVDLSQHPLYDNGAVGTNEVVPQRHLSCCHGDSSPGSSTILVFVSSPIPVGEPPPQPVRLRAAATRFQPADAPKSPSDRLLIRLSSCDRLR